MTEQQQQLQQRERGSRAAAEAGVAAERRRRRCFINPFVTEETELDWTGSKRVRRVYSLVVNISLTLLPLFSLPVKRRKSRSIDT